MKKSLLGCFCLLFVACAQPTQFLRKSYPPAQLQDKGLVVYPLFANQVNVANPDDFADDFEDVKSEPGDFLSREVGDNAVRYFETGFKGIRVESVNDSGFAPLTSANSEKITEKIGKEEFEIRIPKSQYLESKGVKPKFVLAMDQVVFSRNLETYEHMAPTSAPASVNVGGQTVNTGGGAPMTMTTSKQYIAMGVNYVLYDYEEKAVVGYGFAKGEKTFNFAMTQSDWYAAMDKAFAGIKSFTPFK
jgi:hypothetical protein